MWEISAYNYQNIAIRPGKTEVKIKNKNLFVNTADFDCQVTLQKNGRQIDKRNMQIFLGPLEESIFELPFKEQTSPGEYIVTVSFHLSEDTEWAEAGHEIAFGQYVYEVSGEESPKTECLVESRNSACSFKLEIIHGYHNLGVRGENFDALFSYQSNGLVSYRYGGKEMLKTIPGPAFWRAPIDNDDGNGMMNRYAQWKIADLYAVSRNPAEPKNIPIIEEQEDQVTVTYTYHLATNPSSDCQMEYTVFGDGTIRVKLIYDPAKELGDMPLFGMQMKLDADYDCLEWYGLGPQETYSDRCKGAKLGIYSNHVKDNLAKYLTPQECGNKMGVRWAKVTDAKGRGILFMGDKMDFSALPYTAHELENAVHWYELPQIHYTVVRVAMQQMGIGGDDSWGACTHSEYLLDVSEKLEFEFCFRGI